LQAALEGKKAEVDPEVTGYFREHRFRKIYGGSHKDFLDQPVQVTDWLLAIANTEKKAENG